MSFDIDKIYVYESVEFATDTEEGNEGIAVEVKYEEQSIILIDGLSIQMMHDVRMGFIDLLRFIKENVSKKEVKT